MQVVSDRIAGGTDIADHFALFHFLTYGHADRGAVGIQGVKSIIVAYLDMMRWVGMMNNIRACADEIVFNDIVYS